MNIDVESSFTPALSFSITGRICRLGTVFLKAMPVEGVSLASFWRVVELIKIDSKIFFILEDIQTLHFHLDQYSFIVRPIQCYHVIHGDNLPFPVPLQSIMFNGNLHIIPNYYHML